MQLTKRAFIKRLTVDEYTAIKTAAEATPTLDYYWQLFMLAEFIDLDDPDTVAGVTLLEQAGLIAAGRAAEILGPDVIVAGAVTKSIHEVSFKATVEFHNSTTGADFTESFYFDAEPTDDEVSAAVARYLAMRSGR